MNSDLLLARWELGDLRPEDVPAIAVKALDEGCAAPELAVMATLTRPTRLDVEEHLPALLVRVGLERPSRSIATKIVVDDYANEIAERRIEPQVGAREIWMLANTVWDERRLFSQVAIYVGLASEWDDHPDMRSEIEEQIVEEATDFVRRGGLSLD